MSYTVLESMSLNSLCEQVRKYLKNDWVCQGGISSFYDPKTDMTYYLQAMVLPL